MPSIAQLEVPSVTLIWILVGIFVFLTLVVSSIARMRWTRHLKADEVYRISTESSNADNAVFADLVTSVKAMKTAAADLFKAQSAEVSSRFDRLTADNEQIKALLSIKMSDERGIVQAALELVMSECAASQAFRVRQKRREAQVRHAAEAAKTALSISPSPRLRESINRLTRECTTAASESAREVERKYRIRNHASVIGNDAMNLLETNLENEANAERKFYGLLTSTLSALDTYSFSVMEGELERDDTVRLAEERRQQALAAQARQMHTRRVAQASDVLSTAINRLLTMLDSCVIELTAARQNRSDDEKATIELLEGQRAEAEARYETGLLAGLDNELQQGIVRLIRHADGMLSNLATRNSQTRGLTAAEQSSSTALTEAESLAARLITALGDPVSQGLESISAAINDVGVSCAASLNVLPASSWLNEIESAGASGSQILASHNDAEREHVELVLKMHRPPGLDEREEQHLDKAEDDLNTAQDALLTAREQALQVNFQQHQKAVRDICNDLNDAETLRLQNISRIQNRIESLEQNASKASSSPAEQQEDAQRLATLKSEQSSAEAELDQVRKQAQQAVIDAHAAWAAKSRTAMQEASKRHKDMFAKAFQGYVKERSNIAERQRGLAAQADMEASDAICTQLRQIQTGEIVGDAEKLQEAAIKRYHADALVNLTREHREQTRIEKEELEHQRSGELETVKEQHDATIQSIRDDLRREIDTMKLQVSDEIQRAANEQEMTKKSTKAEREAVSSNRKNVKQINEDWSKRIESDLKGLFEGQATERAQEIGDQREELAQFRNAARAKLEMQLLSNSLNESNRDRAKPLIEAAVSSRHEDVRAQLEARQKRETIERLRNTLIDNVKARQRALVELQRARDAGEITMDKFQQSLGDIDREFDPVRAAKDARAQLLIEAASELKQLRVGQAEEVRSIMLQLYPDEDFAGAEWQQVDTNALDELVAAHLNKQKQEEEDAIQQLNEQRKLALDRQNQLAELVAQLESDCEARIANDVAELHALRNAKLEDLDRAHWVAVQDLQDRLQNNQLTPDQFDAEVQREQDSAHSKAAAINTQCQSAVVSKTEALRRQCRTQQSALQDAQELPPISSIVEEQRERNQKVDLLMTEAANALIARGQAVQKCRKAGINRAIALMTNIMRDLPLAASSQHVVAAAGPSTATSSHQPSQPSEALTSSLDRIELLLGGDKKVSHDDKCISIVTQSPPLLASHASFSAPQKATHTLVQHYVDQCSREFSIPSVRFACIDATQGSLKQLHYHPVQRLLVADQSELFHKSMLLTRIARAMSVIALPTPGMPRPDTDVLLDRAISQLASLVSVGAANETSDDGSDDDDWTNEQMSFLNRISNKQSAQ